jgi:thioesterase domain-containing protein
MDVHVVPGDHFTLVREPQVSTLAGLLRESLDAPSAANA